MRGEISPMIAEASTATEPKRASEPAKSAEFLAGLQSARHKTAENGQIFSRIDG
jgi:hypothetical protein